MSTYNTAMTFSALVEWFFSGEQLLGPRWGFILDKNFEVSLLLEFIKYHLFGKGLFNKPYYYLTILILLVFF